MIKKEGAILCSKNQDNELSELNEIEKSDSDDEFETEDIDEHASSKVTPLLNSALKVKFKLNDTFNKLQSKDVLKSTQNKPEIKTKQVINSS